MRHLPSETVERMAAESNAIFIDRLMKLTSAGNAAIIPARGGSTRIPRKNIREFHGKPIITYSINAAFDSELFMRVIVSTEDPEIAEVARRYGASVIDRPPELARNEIGTQRVAMHAAEELPMFERLCVIYPTVPMLATDDLREGLEEALRTEVMYAMAVGDEPLRDAGMMYWGKRYAFAAGVPLIGPRTSMVVVPESRICDVNVEADWARAEEMYATMATHA